MDNPAAVRVEAGMRAAGWVLWGVNVLLLIIVMRGTVEAHYALSGPMPPPHFRRHCTPPQCPPCVPSVQAASVDAIVRACTRYGIEGQAGEMIAVCYRESRLDPNAINPRSGALGLPQWMPATWNEIRWRMNRPCLNPARAEDSAEAMAWCWKHNLSKHWSSK